MSLAEFERQVQQKLGEARQFAQFFDDLVRGGHLNGLGLELDRTSNAVALSGSFVRSGERIADGLGHWVMLDESLDDDRQLAAQAASPGLELPRLTTGADRISASVLHQVVQQLPELALATLQLTDPPMGDEPFLVPSGLKSALARYAERITDAGRALAKVAQVTGERANTSLPDQSPVLKRLSQLGDAAWWQYAQDDPVKLGSNVDGLLEAVEQRLTETYLAGTYAARVAGEPRELEHEALGDLAAALTKLGKLHGDGKPQPTPEIGRPTRQVARRQFQGRSAALSSIHVMQLFEAVAEISEQVRPYQDKPTRAALQTGLVHNGLAEVVDRVNGARVVLAELGERAGTTLNYPAGYFRATADIDRMADGHAATVKRRVRQAWEQTPAPPKGFAAAYAQRTKALRPT